MAFRSQRVSVRRAAVLGLLAATALSTLSAARADAPTVSASGNAPALPRFPQASADRIVFVAHGNLFTVPKSGGTATRLTADLGDDVMPRFSPDGKWIAYTATTQGNEDVYVIPAAGGEARRLTFHSDVVPKAPTRWGPDNMVVTWTPDSKNIVFMSRRYDYNDQQNRLFSVPLAGGLPVLLPLDRGGLLTYGPDGHSFAYTRMFRDFRTWKRYDGGRHENVYTYDPGTQQLDRITDWKGTDTSPMWVGNHIYFLSDRDANRRANIWRYDTDTKQFTAITHFADYDVDFPAYGGNSITFQQGGKLWAIDLPSEQLRQVKIDVPDDGTRTGTRWVKVAGEIRSADAGYNTDYAIAPNGARALFSARGNLYTVPAEHGAIRNLTRTSDADEDHPSWSPDGTTIAYTTDRTGEQQIAVRPAAGGAEKILTDFPTGYFYTPHWSPDGRLLAVADGNHNLWLVDAAGGSEPRKVFQDPYREIKDAVFSPDSKWLAYSTVHDHQKRELHLFLIATGRDTVVSTGQFSDHDPAFSPDGKLLFFVSNRHQLPVSSDDEFNEAAVYSDGIYAATLQADAPSPFPPRSDEGVSAPAAAATGAGSGSGSGRSATTGTRTEHGTHPATAAALDANVVRIDLDGLMGRAVPVPVAPAEIDAIDARGTKLFYMTEPPQLIDAGPLPGSETALHVYDLAERKDAVVVDGLDGYVVSRDGKHVLYQQKKSWHIADADAGHKNDHTLALDGMVQKVEPRAEWREMFDNAWRLERDLFFNPKMNGDDWQKVHDSYAKLLPELGSRSDLTYLIGQIQGEIGNSHTYANGPSGPGEDGPEPPVVPTPLLGCDFALDSATGRYRIARIYPGDISRPAYRSPLAAPGLDIRPGDFLMAVDGQELKAPTNPYSLFVGLDGPITLTVSRGVAGARRDVTVDPIADEMNVREQAWIDHNRAKVSAMSGGRVGYIYLADMGNPGMTQFMRQFYSQLDKQALVIDDRWNGGGNVDPIVTERLRRLVVGLDVNREGGVSTNPGAVVNGPKVVLMNHYSSSDGDIFPYFFRKYGLGKLVGTRTWGGVRGIRGYWPLMDGGSITIPEFALYDLDGKWAVENHGVDPDVEVEDVPGEFLSDHDIQLETATKMMVDQLDHHPQTLPAPPPMLPAYPADGNVPPAHE